MTGTPPPSNAWNPLLVVGILACWLALAGNLPLWRALWLLPEQTGVRAFAFGAGFAVWIAAALTALLSLFAWRHVFKPLAVLLLAATALSSYFMWQYSIVIDATMMANVFNTDAREVRDLLSWKLALCVVLLLVLPVAWLLPRSLAFRPAWPQAWRNLLLCAGSLVLLAVVTVVIYQDLASLMRNHKQVRYLINPLNVVYGSGKLLADQVPRARKPLLPIGEDVRLGASYSGQKRPPLVVLVVGETARAANFSLGGYERATNPQLEQIRAEGGLTYFSAVASCGTNTEASLPCMFSHLGKKDYEAGDQPYENLLDVLQRAGLAVLWLDNQSGCKGLCARIPAADTRTLQVPELCNAGECLDEVMLQGLDERIAALEPVRRARGVVVVMHQMGSHGPAYYRRSSPAAKKFLPECASTTLQDCPRAQIVNAYDNSIVYTDQLLAGTVRWLAAKEQQGQADTAMVYVSDHGESLGENNLYLHGLPYAIAPAFQTHVPQVTWLSAAMQKRTSVRVDCLQRRAAAPLSHDNLFHSVLGLLDLQTGVYKRELDWFAACR